MTKLTRRDMKILWSCADCEVLTTSQVQRWHFGTTSLRKVQKRLHKLVEAGYLNAIETRVCTDNLVLLGKEGQQQLQKKGWDRELKKDPPKDLDHHLGVVDIRIALEKGLENLAEVNLRYFYAYWELGQFAWSYPIIPDALFSIRNAYTATAAVEFDRNRYSLAVFSKKLLQYRMLLQSHPISTVLLVAEQRANVEKLEQGLEHVRTQIPLLIVALEDLQQKGLAAAPQPPSLMYGTRTVAEQLEIDAMRIETAGR